MKDNVFPLRSGTRMSVLTILFNTMTEFLASAIKQENKTYNLERKKSTSIQHDCLCRKSHSTNKLSKITQVNIQKNYAYILMMNN